MLKECFLPQKLQSNTKNEATRALLPRIYNVMAKHVLHHLFIQLLQQQKKPILKIEHLELEQIHVIPVNLL